MSPLARQFDDELWEMESDLPSLANQAAIELDNQILGRGKGFHAVRRLVDRLTTDGVTEQRALGSYDPITVGAVTRAIDDLIPDPTNRPKQLQQAIQVAAKKTEQLRQAADNPLSPDLDLAELRGYCLALSQSASESEWPADENDPRHRFGR